MGEAKKKGGKEISSSILHEIFFLTWKRREALGKVKKATELNHWGIGKGL